MKRTIKTIATIGAMTILLSGAYLLGTTQAKIVTVEKEVEKRIEVVPDGYIALDKCIPLEDIACYFINGYDYLCFELKDVNKQLNNPNNKKYTDIIKDLENTTEEYKNNFIDMRQITDFKTTENGLKLYLKNGNGYYWER